MLENQLSFEIIVNNNGNNKKRGKRLSKGIIRYFNILLCLKYVSIVIGAQRKKNAVNLVGFMSVVQMLLPQS